MTTLIEYFQYPFFQRAFIVGSLISIILSWLSPYIVMRKQVLFTHSLSNVGFLGIAFAILFQLPITITLICFCIFAAFLISNLQRKKIFDNDSLLGIFSQVSLGLAIIVIALFPGYRINIEQFLFGDVLGVSQQDLYITLIFFLIFVGTVIFCHRGFLKISLSNSLSHTLVKRKGNLDILLTLLFAITIALGMKIIGVLLVAAFTTIPANIAKLYSKSLRQTFILSTLLGLFATLSGLYLSTIFDLPSGPLIVVTLGVIFALALLIRRS